MYVCSRAVFFILFHNLDLTLAEDTKLALCGGHTGVGNEVEARELVPLLLEVALQALLTLLQLSVHHLTHSSYPCMWGTMVIPSKGRAWEYGKTAVRM